MRSTVEEFQSRYVLWMQGGSAWNLTRAYTETKEMIFRSPELDAFSNINRLQRPELLAFLCARELEKYENFTPEWVWQYILRQNIENYGRIKQLRWQADVTTDATDILFPYLILGYSGKEGVSKLLADLESNTTGGDEPLISCDILGLSAAGSLALKGASELLESGLRGKITTLRLIDVMRNTSGLESPQIVSPYKPDETLLARASGFLFDTYRNRRDEIGGASAQALAHGNFPVDPHMIIDILTDTEEPYLITNGVYILTYQRPSPDDPKIKELAEPFGKWLAGDDTYSAAIWFLRILPDNKSILEPFILPGYRAILERALHDSKHERRIDSLKFLLEKFTFTREGIWPLEDLNRIADAFSEPSTLELKAHYLTLLNAFGPRVGFDISTITEDIEAAIERAEKEPGDPGAEMLQAEAERALEAVNSTNN